MDIVDVNSSGAIGSFLSKLQNALGLDPGDTVAFCMRGAPVIMDPRSGATAWNFTKGTFKGFLSEGAAADAILIVDTEGGREVVRWDQVIRFVKLSNVSFAKPKVVVP